MGHESKSSATFFVHLAPSVLGGVDPQKVAAFLKERELHWVEVTDRKANLPTPNAVSWKASIDRGILKGEIDRIILKATFYKLKDTDVEIFIKSLMVRPEERNVTEKIKRPVPEVKIYADN